MAKEKIYLFDHSPHLREGWDYEKNIGVDPEKLTYKSHKIVWWVCTRGHSFNTEVHHLTGGRGCPICSGKRVLVGYNDLKTLRPDVAIELRDETYSADMLTVSSNKRLRWECTAGHLWWTSVNNRTSKGSGCGVCSNRILLLGFNDLKSTYPHLANEMDDTIYLPTTLISGSHSIVWWKCGIGHRWRASVLSRTSKGTGCPYCAGQKVTHGVSDLQTLRPDLSDQLVNKSIALSLSPGSHMKVEWSCSSGHVWLARVSSRAGQNASGCPKCNVHATSRVEKRLRILMAQLGNVLSINSAHTLPISYRKNNSMSVDVYLERPDSKIVCEYDGSYYHNKGVSISRDTDKTFALLSAGYIVIRVREGDLVHLDIDHPNLLQLSVPYSTKDDHLIEAVEKIKQWLDEKTTND